MHIAIVIERRKFVFSPTFDRRPMTIGPVVRDKGEEGVILAGLMFQELDCLLREEIDRVTGEAISIVVVYHLVIVKAGRMSVGKSNPMIKGQLRDKRNAQMELSY